MSFVLCNVCNEEWTADSFKAAGTAYTNINVCSACFEEKYPKREVECSGCGRRMRTRGRSDDPMCRPCRRAIAEGQSPAPARCSKCDRPATGTHMIGDLCHYCYGVQYYGEPHEQRRTAA